MKLGLGLKKIRQLRNMTLQDLAKASGISSTSIFKIENSCNSPRPKTLKSICSALSISEASIIVFSLSGDETVPENKKAAWSVVIPLIEQLFMLIVADNSLNRQVPNDANRTLSLPPLAELVETIDECKKLTERLTELKKTYSQYGQTL